MANDDDKIVSSGRLYKKNIHSVFRYTKKKRHGKVQKWIRAALLLFLLLASDAVYVHTQSYTHTLTAATVYIQCIDRVYLNKMWHSVLSHFSLAASWYANIYSRCFDQWRLVCVLGAFFKFHSSLHWLCINSFIWRSAFFLFSYVVDWCCWCCALWRLCRLLWDPNIFI